MFGVLPYQTVVGELSIWRIRSFPDGRAKAESYSEISYWFQSGELLILHTEINDCCLQQVRHWWPVSETPIQTKKKYAFKRVFTNIHLVYKLHKIPKYLQVPFPEKLRNFPIIIFFALWFLQLLDVIPLSYKQFSMSAIQMYSHAYDFVAMLKSPQSKMVRWKAGNHSHGLRYFSPRVLWGSFLPRNVHNKSQHISQTSLVLLQRNVERNPNTDRKVYRVYNHQMINDIEIVIDLGVRIGYLPKS